LSPGRHLLSRRTRARTGAARGRPSPGSRSTRA
jgi:hypothetical protein